MWQCADPGADPGNVGAPGSSVGDPSSGRHGPPSRTFFSVQSEHDARRLHAGGETWPTGLERANLGPGFYAWDNEANAEAYLKLRSQREWAADAKLRIVRATISESDYQSLRMLDLRTWSDEDVDAWMELYSLYGEGRPHGYDHVIRGAGLGDEFYFSPDVFHLFGLE